MLKAISRWKWIFLTVALGMSLVLALNWQALMLGSAAASSELRPRLLSDAGWGDSKSTRKFDSQFAPGTPETSLIAWLQANEFAIDKRNQRAERRIKSMPCNEQVSVTWNANPAGKLTLAHATVTEAGCL